jgi:chromosome partitioning protein
VHLATALAELQRQVLIIDLDANAGATRHFGIPPESYLGTFEVLVGLEQPEDVVIRHDDDEVELPAHVALMPANRKLEKVEQALLSQNKFVVLQDVLIRPQERLKPMFDYIFLDTAPNAMAPTIAAYKAADYFLLSAIPDPFAIAGLSDALMDIEAARVHGNPRLTLLAVILSMMDRRTNQAKTLRDYVQEKFALDGHESLKLATTIDRSTAVPKAQREGKTLFETAPVYKVTDQYRPLVREVELSHLLRASIELFKRGRDEIIEEARQPPGLHRPANVYRIAMASFERRLARLLLAALRKTEPLA